MSIFYFIDASISKHEDIFIVIGFSLEAKRGLSLGELICPFCIMLLYRYLLHYGLLLQVMSQYLWLFLSYFTRFNMKRENAGSWDSGLEKEQILETYSA